MPVIEIIALFFGTISFVATLIFFAQTAEALTNMLFSAIVCLTCVGVVAYAEIIK